MEINGDHVDVEPNTDLGETEPEVENAVIQELPGELPSKSEAVLEFLEAEDDQNEVHSLAANAKNSSATVTVVEVGEAVNGSVTDRRGVKSSESDVNPLDESENNPIFDNISKPESTATTTSKKTSLYFKFMKENREAAKAQLLAAGAETSVTAVAKHLGEMWRKMSKEEKEEYNSRTEEDPLGQGNIQRVSREEDLEGEEETKASLPEGRVKKIMRLDKEIRLVTAEATQLVTKATELFLETLAAAASSAATVRKRKTIRGVEVMQAVQDSRRMRDCIGDSLLSLLAIVNEGVDLDTEVAPPVKRRKGTQMRHKDEASTLRTRTITGFFSKCT